MSIDIVKLNDRQAQALKMVAAQYVTRYVRGSVDSLVGRGLVVVEKKGGRLTGRYFLTDQGRGALAAIRLLEASRPISS